MSEDKRSTKIDETHRGMSLRYFIRYLNITIHNFFWSLIYMDSLLPNIPSINPRTAPIRIVFVWKRVKCIYSCLLLEITELETQIHYESWPPET